MTKRIFRSICLVALIVLLASLVLIMGMLYSYFTRTQLNLLRAQTGLIAHGVNREGSSYFESLNVPNCRITWIDADGTVLWDSSAESGAMENHLQREEIREALDTGYGESTRYSDTLMTQSIYVAQRLTDGTVIRLSIVRDSVLTLLLGLAQPICVIIAMAAISSLFLASRLSRKIVEPLNALDLDDPLSQEEEYSELSPLLVRIDSQQRQLRAQAAELRGKQRQFDTVTASMNEGLVLLDRSGIVLSINPAAVRILGTDRKCLGMDFLTVSRSEVISRLVTGALSGEKAEKNISLPLGEYQVDASPVKTDGVVSGVVLLLFDISERQRAELVRQEFTANVSHELKTPLHSISGYAELLKSGIVRPEDVTPFHEKIYTEAQRLIRLVEDIIRLSRLDEGGGDMKPEPVELSKLAADTLRQLSSGAKLANITLNQTGEPVTVMGTLYLLSGLLTNLCDNAIKYNQSGGSVTVETGYLENVPFLRVSDTGIGIPPEHQDRIFERFYRVDKSHSKDVGGTGLGLSIVKHAARILGARIQLDSTLGKGSVFTVTFPK